MRTSQLVAVIFVGLVCVGNAVTPARADVTDDMWARDAARRADEAWRKRVYGDPRSTPAAPASDDYGAIAYSPATGRYGYSWSYGTLAAAQRAAIASCKADDARPVAWARNNYYCALAVGTDDAWGTGSGPTAAAARAMALRECRSRTTTECRVLVCVRAAE